MPRFGLVMCCFKLLLFAFLSAWPPSLVCASYPAANDNHIQETPA